ARHRDAGRLARPRGDPPVDRPHRRNEERARRRARPDRPGARGPTAPLHAAAGGVAAVRPLLEVDGLGKVFTLHGLGGRRIVGCRDVAFRLDEGRCLALVGASGAGKSTVVKCIYRPYLPSAGRVWYRATAGDVVDLASLDDRAVLRLRACE